MILHKATISPYHLELWIIITDDPHHDISKVNVSNPGINIIWPKDSAAITNDEIWNSTITAVFDKKHFCVDIVAHEAVHIVNMVYMYSGIVHDPKNDEPQAYLTGWVVGEIHKASKMKNKK